MKTIKIIFASLLFVTSLFAQNGKMSSKTGIKKGVLKNGFTYYICNNPAAGATVDFYLLQNVGAILEEDSQQGLAHFLEHMCFNGTKNFPGHSIMDKFSAKGLTYNVNAFTGVDQTVYQMTQIPSNDKAFLDECLFIMYDWCHNATLEREKIDAERPVILEEMRTRNNLQFRINEQTAGAVFNNSKYAYRNIIGPADIIKNFEYQELNSLFETWYRPDLQAAIIIGDIDAIETETKVRNLFSTLEAKENPKERYHITIPDNTQTYFTEICDPEIKNATVKILFRHPYNENGTENYVATILNNMLTARVKQALKDDGDKEKNAEKSFLNLSMSFIPISYGYGNYGIGISYKEEKAEQALKTAFGIQKDLLENGFTQEEFDHAKEQMIESLKRMKLAQGRLPNKFIYDDIRRNFISNTDIEDAATNLKEFEKFVEGLTLEELTKTMNTWYSGPNKSIQVMGGTDTELLTMEQIIAFETAAEPIKVIPDMKDKDDEESDSEEVLAIDLEGAEVIETEKWSDFLAEKWKLKNGATVIYKECNANPELVNIYATSPGGFSALEGTDLINGTNFINFTPAFGIEGFSQEEFENLLKNNQIAAGTKLGATAEDCYVLTRYANIEMAFQILYHQFVNPVIYTDKFNELYKQVSEQVSKLKPTHQSMMRDTLGILRFGPERHQVIDSTWLPSISLDGIENVYHDRYQDAGNFTFYIVGGIGKGKAKKLAEKYIGSIPSNGRNETVRLMENQLPQGRTQKVNSFDIEGKQAGIVYTMDYPNEFSFKNRLTLGMMNSYLQEKLNDEIRQKQRGTYGVHVKSSFDQKSDRNCYVDISFECDPQRAVELDEILHNTVVSLCEQGISQTDFDILKKKLDKPQRPQVKNNSYYINILNEYHEYGINADAEDYYKNNLDSIDLEYMNQSLKKLIDSASIMDMVYLPK